MKLRVEFAVNKYQILCNNTYTGAFFVKTTNCKINIFQNFNSLMYYIRKEIPDITKEEFKKLFITVLKECDITVLFDITNDEFVPYLLENFEYYYAMQIPIGYGKNPTTMICLKNQHSSNNNYHKYLLDKSLVNNL
jgi:hypothetical protein